MTAGDAGLVWGLPPARGSPGPVQEPVPGAEPLAGTAVPQQCRHTGLFLSCTLGPLRFTPES